MAKKPRIPPENRSPKGTGSGPRVTRKQEFGGKRQGNPVQRGRQANIRQNTRNQGYQQDR
jgi:hypothetical protein